MTRYPHVAPFEILLVEDEAGDARLVSEALKESKILCNVHHVWDGEEALAFLRRQGDRYAQAPRPDLVLLDLNLPKVHGRDVLRALREDPAFHTLPVIVLTCSDVERDVEAAYGLGANSYITKPGDMDQFFRAITGIQQYWFGLVRLPNGHD
jgi:CheY-like chemotaxis protein